MVLIQIERQKVMRRSADDISANSRNEVDRAMKPD